MEPVVQEDLTEDTMDEKLHFETSEKDETELEGKVETQSEKNNHDSFVAKTIVIMDADVDVGNTVEENVQCRNLQQRACKDEAKDGSFSLVRNFQKDEADTIQISDEGENMPYFTIGPDPQEQSSSQTPEQICAQAWSKKETSRPLRRVLSWPPTAAQWKKRWSQNQDVFNVSPHLVFLTQYTYQVSLLPPTSPVIRVGDSLEPSGESVIRSCIQSWPTSTNGYVYLNERSDPDSIPPPDDGTRPSTSITSCNPLYEETTFKGVGEASVTKSKKKSTHRAQIRSGSERTGHGSGKRPWRRDRKGDKVEKKKPRNRLGSGSGPGQSGCSPSDDNLLVGNEYTFIDLLHEVVENQGRWTRERWRQSHINKSKNKQFTSVNVSKKGNE